jgi:hypothetical protein
MTPTQNIWLQLYRSISDDMRFHQTQITRLEQRLYDIQRAILNNDAVNSESSEFNTRNSRRRSQRVRTPGLAARQEPNRFTTPPRSSSNIDNSQTRSSLDEYNEEEKEEYPYNTSSTNNTSNLFDSLQPESSVTYLGSFDFPINQLNTRRDPLTTSFARSILNRSSLSGYGGSGSSSSSGSSYDPSTLLLYFMMENLANSDRAEPHGITDVSRYITDLVFYEIDDPPNTCCPIKMDVFTDDMEVSQINKCKHIFCRQEIRTWLESHHTCPLCRTEIDT